MVAIAWEVNYLNVRSKVFAKNNVKDECAVILCISNLLHIMSFTDIEIKRMLRQTNRVKIVQQNKLRRDCLESLLRMHKEGASILEIKYGTNYFAKNSPLPKKML